jgi:hypothetical protein
MLVRHSNPSQSRPREGEAGMALLATIMVMMLLSALMVGFVSAIVADQTASGLNRDQTQAYAAAHAGLEKLTSDMSTLFARDVSPSAAQINQLVADVPVIANFEFRDTDGTVGYKAAARFMNGGNPAPENPAGSDIANGPFQGLKGIITPYDITVTARSRGGAEVRLRRTLQTVSVPVFQFGMFSETSLAFHAGGGNFTFGGRVHTNGDLFLAHAAGATLTVGDRVTALGEVVRWSLPNGTLTDAANYGGNVSIATGGGGFRNLTRTEGSVQEGLGSAQNEPRWTNLSIGTYKQYIRNGRTGVRRLNLPIVADLDGDGNPDAQPIELIKRPALANPDPQSILDQRYFTLASVRILLSDNADDITNLPTVTGPPVALVNGVVGGYATGGTRPPFAESAGQLACGTLPANVHKSDVGQPTIGGFIKIEIQRNPPAVGWQDVTMEILNHGIAGRNITSRNAANTAGTAVWNGAPGDNGAVPVSTCPLEPMPNSILRLQRVRDVPQAAGFNQCGQNGANMSQDTHDYWPLALYDTRESQFRDGLRDIIPNTPYMIRLGGIMNYLELDIANLSRWLQGLGAYAGGSGTSAKNENGFVVYFSDRRNNRNPATNRETGEYGMEDVVNTPDMLAPTGQLETGEDVNGDGQLQNYGGTAQAVHVPLCTVGCLLTANPFSAGSGHMTVLPNAGGTNPDPKLVARANRNTLFRRALKLVNGGQGNIVMPGLTIVSENPVYVQGNYNATSASANVANSAAAAIIADAVTLLSTNWNDIRSFTSPGWANNADVAANLDRDAATTGYRMAVITGKGRTFPKPNWAEASFGSDGGVHNFFRLLENWGGQTIRYRGSLVSLYFNRQGTGIFKCCDYDVYNPGTRAWEFDTNFLLPNLLPPGTPMFRDVNTLTFRQLLRPTQ